MGKILISLLLLVISKAAKNGTDAYVDVIPLIVNIIRGGCNFQYL